MGHKAPVVPYVPPPDFVMPVLNFKPIVPPAIKPYRREGSDEYMTKPSLGIKKPPKF